MGGFNNPVVGALNLIRKAIRSPDYQAGVSGWSINQDGSAEFNNAGFRGDVTVGSATGKQVHIYNNAGVGTVEFLNNDSATETSRAKFTAGLGSSSDGNVSVVNMASGSQSNHATSTFTIASASQISGSVKPFMQFNDTIGGGNPIVLVVDRSTFVTNSGSFQSNASQVTFGNAGSNLIFSASNFVARFGSAWYGSVNITPVANTPTGVTITGIGPVSNLGTLVGFTTPNTSVPGTTVTGTGISGITATQCTVWLTRTNTTATTVFYQVIGQ